MRAAAKPRAPRRAAGFIVFYELSALGREKKAPGLNEQTRLGRPAQGKKLSARKPLRRRPARPPITIAQFFAARAPADEKPGHAKTACGLLSEEEENPRLFRQSAKHRPELSAGTIGFWAAEKQNKKPLFAAKRSQRKRQRQRGGCAPNILPNAKRSKQVEIGSKRLLLPSEIAFRPEPAQGRSAAFEEMGLDETRGHNPAPLNPPT